MKHPYQKVICLCCFLILFVNIGLPSTSFSVFQHYIVEQPYIGDTGGSMVLATRTGVSFVCMFFVSLYYQKLNVRRGAFLASIFVFLGFLTYSFADSLPLFCVASGLTGAGYGLGGMIAVNMIISRWFAEGIGEAVSFAAVGTGIAGTIIPPVMGNIIESFSLSTAFRVEAVVAIALGLIAFALMRENPPQEFIVKAKEAAKSSPSSKGKANLLTKPLPKKVFALMILAMVMLGCVSVDAPGYIGVLFISEGIDSLYVATLIGVMGACLTIGKLLSGFIFDKAGTLKSSIFMFCLFAGGVILVTAAAQGSNGTIALASVIIFGAGLTLGTVGISIWSLQLSTAENVTKTIRNFQIAYAFGGFIFNLIPGLLKELCGTYLISYYILIGMAVICAIIVIGIYIKYATKA